MDLEEWHLWFAWKPVEAFDTLRAPHVYKRVWWKHVLRRKTWLSSSGWQYLTYPKHSWALYGGTDPQTQKSPTTFQQQGS